MKNSHKGIVYASLAALMWGVLAIGLKVQVKYLSAASIVGFRFFLPFVILVAWMFFKSPGQLRIFWAPPFRLILAALLLAFNYFGFMMGVSLTSPSTAQVFIQFGPFLFALSGIILFHEKIDWHHYLGFFILTAGIGLFYSEQLKEIVISGQNLTRGMIWTLSAGFSWAAFAVLQKKLVAKYSVNELNVFIYGLCSLLFLPFFHFSESLDMPGWTWFLLLGLGLNTLIAYGSFALSVKYMDANKVSVIVTLNPIITFIIMEILARLKVGWIEPEHFTPLSITGAVGILAGAVMVIVFNVRKSRKHRRKIAMEKYN